MRTIATQEISTIIIRLIESAAFRLSPAISSHFSFLRNIEKSERARHTLEVLIENAHIAQNEHLPLCQDCGTTIVFAEIGQDVSIVGNSFTEAVNEGIQTAYEKLYLRKSIVSDPLQRINTGTNTPGFVHIDIVPGNTINLTIYLKGGGSENASALKMFNPTAHVDEIISWIVEIVKDKGANACPPLFVGIGIGGTADVAMLNAKKAVLRELGTSHSNPFYAKLEYEILQRLNELNIGPLGLGGYSTAAAVFIKESPTHIATLPVALNLNCHALRYARGSL
ncbi:MAG: fumarate hydratase [Spirochaetes bacterium]|nr:fumarate hydratase [Spirochaetota bacterium]